MSVSITSRVVIVFVSVHARIGMLLCNVIRHTKSNLIRGLFMG